MSWWVFLRSNLMPRSVSSFVSLRLTVDLGIPSRAAAFDRLRLSTTLPNTSRASRSKGSRTVLFHRCVPNMQQGVAALHLFRPFHQLLPFGREVGLAMSHNSLVTKPASGHWTDAYPELGRGPVSLEDCVSEEFYEKEREHVFKKTWLYMGRVERGSKSGSYFTRELRFLNTSIIIVRGKDDVIRAFHNICPHRGNKMLWEDDPFQEVSGRAPLLYCRFHGWRYKLDGSLHSAPQGSAARLRRRAAGCRRSNVRCEGFIFINLDPHNTEPVRSFLGDWRRHRGLPLPGATPGLPVQDRIAVQLEDLPRRLAQRATTGRTCASSFGALTAEAKMAGLNEPVHRRAGLPDSKVRTRMFSFSGEPSQKTPYSKPIECVLEASAAGAWNKRIERSHAAGQSTPLGRRSTVSTRSSSSPTSW